MRSGNGNTTWKGMAKRFATTFSREIGGMEPINKSRYIVYNMKRANLIFLGIGVVVILLVFLFLMPVREGAAAKLTTKTTLLMDTENISKRVIPVTDTSAQTKPKPKPK